MVLTIAVLGLFFELLSWGALAYLQGLRPIYFQQDWGARIAALDDAWIDEFYARSYDPVLGWDHRPGEVKTAVNSAGKAWRAHYGRDGARFNPLYPQGPPAILSYGDSFTDGAEVNDDQTWQYYLSQRLDRHVANFGVSGYGVGQALLKYKVKHGEGYRPAAVILAIYEEDLDRAVNRFRPYYLLDTSLRLGFKPRFTIAGGVYRLLANPLAEPIRDRGQLARLAAAAAEDDFWYAQRMTAQFPYTLSLAAFAARVAANKLGVDLPLLGIRHFDFWSRPDATALMAAMVGDFIATATAREAIPVVLFLPLVKQSWDKGSRAGPYAAFLRRLRNRHAGGRTLFVDIAEARFEAASFNVTPYSGHPSPYGNRVIADHLAQALAEALDRIRIDGNH